ncbi:MAG: hypothetical protein KDA99_09125 [Planctomycetales bacterium]|nr:hypothetical protein [Planctomycetales bacterium]
MSAIQEQAKIGWPIRIWNGIVSIVRVLFGGRVPWVGIAGAVGIAAGHWWCG